MGLGPEAIALGLESAPPAPVPVPRPGGPIHDSGQWSPGPGPSLVTPSPWTPRAGPCHSLGPRPRVPSLMASDPSARGLSPRAGVPVPEQGPYILNSSPRSFMPGFSQKCPSHGPDSGPGPTLVPTQSQDSWYWALSQLRSQIQGFQSHWS